MSLYPLNLVVEGPSDEIYLRGALQKLEKDVDINSFDIKFFPGGSASAAGYLFEWLKRNADNDSKIKLLIDGDKPGKDALSGLIGRGKRDQLTWKANSDYFQLSLDIENLLSDNVKRMLFQERPAQVHMTVDVNDKITSFKSLDGHKKAVAHRAIEISEKKDLKLFKALWDRIAASV